MTNRGVSEVSVDLKPGKTLMSSARDTLADRIREIRLDQFGEHGIPALSKAMEIPARTWENFEAGVQMPGSAMLRFIEVSGVDPHWLLTGEGDRYRAQSQGSVRLSTS
jgi:hypothetical protein